VADYGVVVARSAEKEIGDLPPAVLSRIRRAIDRLAINPRPSGCKKLREARNRWRVRVGDYRIIYTVNDLRQLIDIERVRHRKDVYR
jgi:mRNA interferase RelE/StbE